MENPASLRAQSKRLLNFLQTAVEKFRNGEDAPGIDSLQTAVAELENLVEIDQSSQRPQVDMSRLLPAVKRLYFYIQNQDITGIADLLEDVFYPLTEELFKGCEDT